MAKTRDSGVDEAKAAREKGYRNPSGPRPPRQRVWARSGDVLKHAIVNRGTAFTQEERRELGLVGLQPSGVVDIDGQMRRVYEQFRSQPDPLAKNLFLSALRDRNETLFYRLLSENLEEMLPIVYTPTIGEAIERFSHWYMRPSGVFLSIDEPDAIEESYRNYGLGSDDVDLVVVTDAEGILGIGDQGVGGVMIASGKLAVYTAAAGIHPRRAIPVVLDVGTDNLGLLNDDLYIGARHARVRGERYDAFVEKFVEVTTKLYPHAMIHWEDFGAGNAHRILSTYRERCCTFNDDIQGTAAVVLAAALSACRTTHTPIEEQRVVVHGAGTAGIGIVELMRDEMVRAGLSPEEANARFWCLGSRGLISEHLGDHVRDFQRPFARTKKELADWKVQDPAHIGLADVVRHAQPTVLIGTSAQAGAFTKDVVQEMARHTERPIVFPLSNPTSKAEALPEDLLDWTDGKALLATGSPFEPVEYGDVTYEIAQANNALVFPGIGLAVTVCRPTRVTDHMIAAAAEAVGRIGSGGGLGSSLLPPVDVLRAVSGSVAMAVCAAAEEDGVARVTVENPVQEVFDLMWQPTYRPIDAV
ncbi:NAD-dependent malic enzyme [Mobilicoccus pelagius]|uniref:Malolactic enzyme n=1 Tax=Mobilicoccus pelagius NBRC 104925 TaxID=1089455 RepID=H5UQA1_9MICO|nr:NAD-dependent malic enzyme [Mobilicoccus pelagius]GAB47909.1 putative NADP-dependent malic enzyme [Mobilicoccus pelagius NBRC 104925]